MAFKLDPRLLRDSHELFVHDDIHYLLHANAEVIWFILVPVTEQFEFYRLDEDLQQRLCLEINRLSDLMRSNYHCDKINLATIGNVVEQMHIHIVARRKDDAYWPDVVWGQPFDRRHSAAFVAQARELLRPN